ncbi:MAG: hypothetical protein AAB877_00985 [Patescibacteria group bacterium]
MKKDIGKDKSIIQIIDDIKYIESVFKNLLNILPSFNVTDEKILPYGLKPHTRSVSWLVEQVIVQQTKYNANKLKLTDVNFNFSDTSLHDCEIQSNNKKYYINVKIHNIDGKENKNDISAVEKMYFQYTANPEYNLIYACFGISFENVTVHFDKNYMVIFSPQFMPIYINSRNDKIQAQYKHEIQLRTRKEFLNLLKKNSKSIILS